MLILSLFFGLAAAFGAYSYLSKKNVESRAAPQSIIAAAVDISPRTIIRPEMVRIKYVPKEQALPDALKTPAEVVGHVAMGRIAKDTIITTSVVEARGAALGLSYTIPPGMRAITVSLDPITGLAGFLKPGDHVDVIATFTGDNEAGTKTILQDVELLAIGAQLQGVPPTSPEEAARAQPQPNATLSVTPMQAELLILAESQGKLRLVLRPAGEALSAASRGITTSQLLGGMWQTLHGGRQVGKQYVEVSQTRRAPPPRATTAPLVSRQGRLPYQATGPAPIFAAPLSAAAAASIAAQQMLPLPGEREIEIIRGGRVERVKMRY